MYSLLANNKLMMLLHHLLLNRLESAKGLTKNCRTSRMLGMPNPLSGNGVLKVRATLAASRFLVTFSHIGFHHCKLVPSSVQIVCKYILLRPAPSRWKSLQSCVLHAKMGDQQLLVKQLPAL
jgi:hypothetical protein